MPVTELALLRTKKQLSPQSALNQAQQAQKDFSTYPVNLLIPLDDSSSIYLVGGWDSPGQHYNEWIPSSTNQELLRILRDEVEVGWMFHIDVTPGTAGVGDVISTCMTRAMKTGSSTCVVSVVECSVGPGRRADFCRAFEALELRVGSGLFCGGWKIEGDEDVFVMFCTGRDGEGAALLAESGEFGMMKGLSDDVRVKHLVQWHG
jgi:hypothetical protein